MPALARNGDPLDCGDKIKGLSTDCFIEGKAAVRLGDTTEGGAIGHCHGSTSIYADDATSSTRPAITINGIPAALVGDWNVPAASQPDPTYDMSTGGGPCGISCGSICHDSQITSGADKVTAG